MMQDQNIVYFELFEVDDYERRQISIEEASSVSELDDILQKVNETDEVGLVVVTLPDDTVWEMGREEVIVFMTEAKENATWRVLDKDGKKLFDNNDFSKVVEYIYQGGDVDQVSRFDNDGNATPVDITVFAKKTDIDFPELPVNKPMDFHEQRPATRPFKEGDEEESPVAIEREAYQNLEAILDAAQGIIERLTRDEKRIQDIRKKQRRPVGKDDGSPWLRTIADSHEHAALTGDGQRSLGREDAEWRQQYQHEGKTVRTGSPIQRMVPGSHSKDEIAMYIERKRGGGVPFDVMLPFSGFWVRFRPPKLADWVELQYELGQLKLSVGSMTKGLAFSNMSQTLKTTVFDWCIKFLTGATCEWNTPTDIKEKVALVDQDLFFWGVACTVYPRGFPYTHACVADPEKCQHEVKETLNLNNLIWYDMSSLSEKQRRMLAQRNWDRPSTNEELETYRSEHRRGIERTVWFDDGIGLKLRVPSVYEYELAGYAWIDSLKEMTNKAYNEPPHGSSRARYIEELALATSAQQYAHWVSAIYEQSEDSSEPIELSSDRELIESVLSTTFSDSENVETFFEHVGKFIDDCMLGIIAVPSFNCPSCDTPVAKKFNSRFPHLVALDMMKVFFTLHSRKLRD